MKELSIPGFYSWSVFSDQKQMDFNGHVWVRDGGNVMIDPVAMSAADLNQVKDLGGIQTCVITNADHSREAAALRERLGFEVVCHADDKAAIGVDEARTVKDGEDIVPGLTVVHLRHGKTPGEFALWLAEHATVITGDILQGAPVGSVRLPPDSKLEDPPRAALEIRKLLHLPFEVLLVGDGHSLFGGAREPVVQALERRADIELHRLQPEDLLWSDVDFDGRYAHEIKRVSQMVGARKLAYNLLRLPPGSSSGPMHFHLAEEELFVVVEGRCTLETPRGRTELPQESFVACPPGEAGAHQLINDSDAPCVVLAVSDVVEHDKREQTGLADFRSDSIIP